MENTVTAKTVRGFAADMIEHYDKMREEGMTPGEIVAFARQFFTGLVDGKVRIDMSPAEAAALKKFASTMVAQFNRLKSDGATDEEILSIARNYFIGLVDGIDMCLGKPAC